MRSMVRSVGEIIGWQSLEEIIGWQSLDEIISLTNYDNLNLQQATVGVIRGGGDKL